MKEIELLKIIFKDSSDILGIINDIENQFKQKENIKKEAREYIESYMPNYDFDKTNLIKLLEIFDKGE